MSAPEPNHNELTETLTGTLESYPEIQLAILYGSCARRTQRPDSDVDLGVAEHPRKSIDYERLLDISLESSRATGREVQVRDLARANGVFLKEVLTTGIVIVSRDTTVRAELIIRMLGFVEDMLPNVRMIRRRNVERFLGRS